MCLLVTVSRDHPESPLIVAANRDELLDRPAVAMTVLQAAGPRILGGRDELAGGTWLAVNESGVVAGLTNQPATAGRDPTKRSRGELPLALARHPDAPAAVEWLAASVRPSDYNPAWMMVADRRSLFYVDLSDGDAPAVTELPPGT
ncbi:MAG TPA: NRDE family protein, partial [Actinomycetota bacterium]|nr:NRDE family protein [Actinomycetota bacterium]